MIAINNIVTILFRLQFHKKKLIYRLRDLSKKDKIRMQLQSIQRNNFVHTSKDVIISSFIRLHS